jgi:hypothetical protein
VDPARSHGRWPGQRSDPAAGRAVGLARHAGHLPNLDRRALPFLPLELARDRVHLKLFTTITTLGTPHDVTVHKLRLESFFPADEASACWFRQRFGG